MAKYNCIIFFIGWLGLPLIFGVFSLQIYTAILLGRSWSMAEELYPELMASQDRYPYAALARLTLGEKSSRFVAFLLDFTVFGAGIPNIVVAAQSLQLFGLKMTDNDFNFSYCYWILILGALQCPIMWLGSPKDMKLISGTSVVIVCGATLMISLCIISDTTFYFSRASIPTLNEFSWDSILTTYGIIAFQFDIHPLLLTIQVDMKDKRQITKAVVFAFGISTIFFLTITILSVLHYGSSIDYNILKMLPASKLLYFVIFLVTLQLTFTSAVCNSALYQDIEDGLGIPREFNYRRCLLRTFVMVISVIIAESVPRFDIVMGLIGGTLTGPLMFILPTIFYVRLLLLIKTKNIGNYKSKNIQNYESNLSKNLKLVSFNGSSNYSPRTSTIRKIEKRNFIIPGFVLSLGIILTVATAIFCINDTIRYASFKPACIFNITEASADIFD